MKNFPEYYFQNFYNKKEKTNFYTLIDDLFKFDELKFFSFDTLFMVTRTVIDFQLNFVP